MGWSCKYMPHAPADYTSSPDCIERPSINLKVGNRQRYHPEPTAAFSDPSDWLSTKYLIQR
ncbi:hypothetical protein I7I53_09165 [Histoplasma capsulatum var. duboisii H88]|uniref:Uncharacterized protein n=1 Tax=Ajellomyces capsulatus (strain H88) TaxID=544711 RepID=A0A8A1L4S1_AJEC8|nr:hypothetical protein I7I53_09165 [Histoplasma capsulatum var. duboisii H88]